MCSLFILFFFFVCLFAFKAIQITVRACMTNNRNGHDQDFGHDLQWHDILVLSILLWGIY